MWGSALGGFGVLSMGGGNKKPFVCIARRHDNEWGGSLKIRGDQMTFSIPFTVMGPLKTLAG
ncbi:MAG: hypothetical protein KDA68_23525, partial [Planctomycetaceae bacterium]|nr:hypothetical protein [Planctomycetaceae bacterium]